MQVNALRIGRKGEPCAYVPHELTNLFTRWLQLQPNPWLHNFVKTWNCSLFLMINNFTEQIHSWKLIVAQLVWSKNSLPFIECFIIMFTAAHHWPKFWGRCIQSRAPYPTSLRCYNIIPPSMPRPYNYYRFFINKHFLPLLWQFLPYSKQNS